MKRIIVITLATSITLLTVFTMNYSNGKTIDCDGVIDSHPEVLEIVTDTLDTTNTNLIKRLVLPKDNGGLCMGSIFKVKKPIVVYRVWNSSDTSSLKGRWWTFDKPIGTLEDFRKDYGVCCQWGPKDTLSACTLKVGSKIVVGPGQSVDCTHAENRGGDGCNDTRYEISAKNQVYIHDPVNNVENCNGVDWPIN